MVELRRAYSQVGIDTLERRLAEYHNGNRYAGGFDAVTELPEMEARLRRLRRFSADMQRELNEIDATELQKSMYEVSG